MNSGIKCLYLLGRLDLCLDQETTDRRSVGLLQRTHLCLQNTFYTIPLFNV